VPKAEDSCSINKTKQLVADRRLSRRAVVLTLRAYLSRIVPSVGCAALMLLLVATPFPTFGAATARAVEPLSAAELATLPDTTLVKLKTGRTATLGVLRSEHTLRLQRFADAAKLGALLLATQSRSEEKEKKGRPGTLVPMNFSLRDFQSTLPLPADFLAFCKAAAATACLYLPGVKLFSAGSYNYLDFDPLITDQHLCTSEGGQPNFGATKQMLGCAYYYPTQYILKFNPGLPTAQGYPVTHSASCPSRFVSYMVDPHGAISLNVVDTSDALAWGPLTSLKTCVVRVFVKK